MLAIFRKGVANPPEELKFPEASEKQAMHPEEILRSFHSSHSGAVSTSFADGAALAYSPNFSSSLLISFFTFSVVLWKSNDHVVSCYVYVCVNNFNIEIISFMTINLH